MNIYSMIKKVFPSKPNKNDITIDVVKLVNDNHMDARHNYRIIINNFIMHNKFRNLVVKHKYKKTMNMDLYEKYQIFIPVEKFCLLIVLTNMLDQLNKDNYIDEGSRYNMLVPVDYIHYMLECV